MFFIFDMLGNKINKYNIPQIQMKHRDEASSFFQNTFISAGESFNSNADQNSTVDHVFIYGAGYK